MPTELFDAEGNLVEAFTEAEVQAKIDEAKNELEGATGEEKIKLTEQLETLQEQLKTANEDLERFKGKDLNFGKLRDQKEIAEQAVAKATQEFEKKLNDIKATITNTRIDEEITKAVGDDKEIKSKVRFYYDSFKGEPATPEEHKTRLDNAIILATGSKPNDPLRGQVISGAGGYVPSAFGGSSGKISPEAKGVAGKMGITDDELKENKLI